MSSTVKVRYLDRTTPPHISTLILMAGIQALSLSIFLPSLPSMATHFGVDYAAMQLTVSLYLMATAFVQISAGPLSDRFGRRPIMIGGVVIFVVATLGCLVAPNYGTFLALRIVQTSVATGMVMSRAVVRDMVPREEAASMIGYVTMGMSIVPMISPAIGGTLDSAFGWQSSFWVLVAAGLLLLFVTYFDQGETHAKTGETFSQQLKSYPALLTSQRFWAYNLATAFSSGAFFAYLGGAPFVGTDAYNLDTGTLGLYLGAPAVGYLVGNGITGRYAARVGINTMVLVGGLVSFGGMASLAVLTAINIGSAPIFFSFMIFIGLGNGLVIPNSTSGMLSIKPELAGSAAGLGGAFMIGGGAALSALAGFVLFPGSGPMPLVVLMAATCFTSVLCALWVIRRDRIIAVN